MAYLDRKDRQMYRFHMTVFFDLDGRVFGKDRQKDRQLIRIPQFQDYSRPHQFFL